mgnify:CR=1 FL=1
MPVSKKPRKKGQRARDLAVRKKFIRGQFKDADDARRTIASIEDQRRRQRKRCEQLGWFLGFQEKDSLLNAFTLSFFALERWPTTTDYSDFNQISSSLMLGALCHKALGVAETELMDDIQHAAFMTVVCARLRNHGKEIPPANLEPVKHGLIVAQELMEYAYDHERQALINVLKHNTHENIHDTPGLLEAHERFILGKHYEQVRQWEIEDDAFLGELQKTGKFQEGEGK